MPRDTLLDFFEDFASSTDLFLIHDDGYRVRQATYAEVAAAARAFAARLDAAGIGANDKVAIWSENRIEWVVALWGCLLRRVVLVPVDFRASGDLLARIAAIVEAKAVLVGVEVEVPAGLKAPVWKLAETEVARPSEPPGTPRNPKEPQGTPNGATSSTLAEIIFTSGATSDPKGVTITHKNLLANIIPIEREVAKYRKYERPFHPVRFLNLLPLSHMFGQSMATFVPPMLEGTVVFSHGYSPTEILHQIKSRRISVLVCVPKVLDVLRDHVERVLPIAAETDVLAGKHFLRRWWRYRAVHRLFGWKFWCIVCGAAPLEPELEAFWRKLGFLVVQGYGLTETAPIVTLNHPFSASKGSVGKPIEGVEVRIAEDGEILVRGDNVTSGYFQTGTSAPEESSAFKDGWFHTGDIGELDANGRLVIKGRKKEMIATPQGLKVFPEDVERALLAQPGVKDAGIVGRVVGGEERIHAVLVVDPGAEVEAIVRGANATLEDHQRVWSTSVWPGTVLPRTEGTQKLKRKELQRWVAGEMSGASAAVGRGTTVEDVVARFVAGRQLTRETTLDELGLSSLDRVEMLMALEEAFQVTLDESSLSEARTLADLASLVRADATPAGSSGDQLRTQNLELKTSNEPIAFPSWNRSRFAWFLRRISLPTWILPLARVFVKLDVRGLEHLANITGPVIFASNHQSHMDTPAIFLALPPRWRYNVAPAMAKEFFRAHFYPKEFSRMAWFTNSLNYYLSCMFFNAFPLPQREAGTRQTLRYIGEITAGGYSILIFPEGARHPTGAMDRFRPGVAMIGARLDVPVVPVRLDDVDRILDPHWKWPKRGTARVSFGAPQRLTGDNYEALAKQVEDAVRALERAEGPV
ncbi:MAG TPA: AMP-binding protein [Vicinamibacterales bacterium]|nr:AMP-binding protein [Vicinamibacterales bacterium]